MFVIKSIICRKILNSHVSFTNEFIVEFEDGSIGVGASPQGETISIYEDRKFDIEPQAIISTIYGDGLVGPALEQSGFDQYLQSHISQFGRNNAYGLSEAFFYASAKTNSVFDLFGRQPGHCAIPRICLNILNGGWHAYTNPVLSDFSEFMLVARNNNILEVVADHNEIQRVVREKQLTQAKTVVSGNPVNCFATRDNREVLDFLLKIVDDLNLLGKYDLMIDASAGDLWKEGAYRFNITDGRGFSGGELVRYWVDLIENYKLRFLEDPFHEKDFSNWREITAAQQDGFIIGDNLYSSDEERIVHGVNNRYTTGVVIKPNQAGAITAARRSLEAVLRAGQVAITSHRSISAESTFLSLLTCLLGAQYIKIGPLVTDYSSVVRLNEIIRLAEGRYVR
jgi:enolase